MTLYALDGTSNRLSGGPQRWTHVALMAAARCRSTPQAITGDMLEVDCDHVMYQRGVGSGTKLDKFFGGATGFGAKRRARKAYQKICENYANPDATAEDLTIDIVGFSRGAATALHLANVIYMMGIRRPLRRWNSLILYRISVGWIRFKDWPRLDEHDIARITQRLNELGLPDEQLLVYDDIVVPRIRFLGLYDTVSSFVLPMDTRIVDLQSFGFGFRLHAPPNVAECSHALALDERRKSFRNVRVHPASMHRARALRSNEVGGGALALVWIIAALWLLYAVIPDSLGAARPWTIIGFIGALAVAFTHMLRGAIGDFAALAKAGERTDIQHETNEVRTTDISDVTGLAADHIAELTGVPAESPGNAARLSSNSDPVRAMAPALGALFALVGLALVDWFGGFDSTSVGPWDYGTAVAWAFVTSAGLAIMGPALAADSTSLRTRDEVIGLAARRLSGLSVVAAWLLATWWVAAIATHWWDHDRAAPWLWRALVIAIGMTMAAGFVASYRPTNRLAKLRSGRTLSAGRVSDVALAVAALTAAIMFVAWIVRRIASRGVLLATVPWWEYVAVIVGAGLLAGTLRWLQRREVNSVPPTLDEIYGHFLEREAREMWFRGNHTDIGGGGAPDLCDHPLQWMTAEAGRAGLAIDLDTVASALKRRVTGTNPDQVGPTFDPLVARARRLVLEGDLGHASLAPSMKPVPEDPRTMGRFNLARLVHGSDLLYDPVEHRSKIGRWFVRRFMSPYQPRFVGILGRIPDPDGASFEWTLETSAGLLFESTQQKSIDRWT